MQNLNLLRPAHTSSDDARQGLFADIKQKADAETENPDNADGKAGDEPERRADVLLLAHRPPVPNRLPPLPFRIAGYHGDLVAEAGEASALSGGVAAVSVLARAVTVGAVVGASLAAVLGLEALRDGFAVFLLGPDEGLTVGRRGGGSVLRGSSVGGFVGEDGFGVASV